MPIRRGLVGQRRRLGLLVLMLLAPGLLGSLAASQPAAGATTLSPVNLDPIHITTGNSEDGAGPEVAYDGSNFFIVWHDGGQVLGAFVTPDGELLADPGVITIEDAGGWRPSVVHNGSGFFVAWADSVGAMDATREIRGVRVGADGGVLDATPFVLGSGARLRRISLAFDGTNYLAVWRTGSDLIQAQRITQAGAPLDGAGGFNVGDGFYPAVVFADGQYLIVWHHHGTGLDVAGRLVQPDGTLGATLPIAAETADQHHAVVATDGSDFMVVFKDGRFGNDNNDSGTSAVRVSDAGAVLDDPPIQVSEHLWGQGTLATVAWDGTSWVVAWPEDKYPVKHRLSDVYARRLTAAGAFVDAQPIPLLTGFSHQVAPTVRNVGDRYLVAYMDRGPPCPFGSICTGLALFDEVAADAPLAPTDEPPVASTWETLPSPLAAPIHTVWAFGNDSAFAGTEPDDGPLLEWDGSDWSVVTNLPDARKYGIWGANPSRVFAIGREANVVWWDGSQARESGGMLATVVPGEEWEFITPMGTGVWGFGEDRIVSAGLDGVTAQFVGPGLDAFHNADCVSWDGGPVIDYGDWRCDRIRASLDNWDIWGRYPDDVYVAGEFGTLAHFDGSNWSQAAVPTGQSLNGVWGSCAGETWAVGDNGTILHDDGSGWEEQQSPTTDHLTAVAGFSGDDVYAVGVSGTIVHYDGSDWTAEDSGTDNVLEDVAADDSTVWVVGSNSGFSSGGDGTILRKQVVPADATAPRNPRLSSFTHPNQAWTRDSTIELSLDGGCDDGRGISGFSVALDQSAGTVPPPVASQDAGDRTYAATVADGEHHVHLRTVDRAGQWSGAGHLGPLRVDTTPPQVSVTGSRPALGGWTNDGRFDVSWRAGDAHAGVAGYSYVVDQEPDTVPATYGNLGGGVTELMRENLAPGQWYLHLRAVDGADGGITDPQSPVCQGTWPCGNWSDTIHIGPFGVDVEPPANPTATSPSHALATTSADPTVEIALGAAADDRSGAAGFSYSFAPTPDADPGTSQNLDASATGVTSPPLPDGDWWFVLRTRDNAGNWSQPSALGPFRIGSLTGGDPVFPDTVAPLLRAAARGRQRAGRPISIRVRSDEDAAALADGAIRVSAAPKRGRAAGARRLRFRLKPARARLSAGQTKALKLRPRGSARRAKRTLRRLRRLVRRGARARASITVTLTDAAGNTDSAGLRLTLRP